MRYLLAAIFTSLLVLATACSQAPPPTKSASNGIQVHGHWTITVSNPDGTVDAVHEFDNTLAEKFGDLVLMRLLIGTTRVARGIESTLAEPIEGWIINLVPENDSTQLLCKENMEGTAHGLTDTGFAMATIGTTLPALVYPISKSAGGYGITLAAVCNVEEILGVTSVHGIGKVSTLVATQFINSDGTDKNNPPSFHGFTEHSLSEILYVENEKVISINVHITFD